MSCGYSLHGHCAHGGACPECGVPVVPSQDPPHLSYVNLRWLSQLCWGATIILSAAVTALSAVVLLAMWPVISSQSINAGVGVLITAGVLGAASGVQIFLGTWILCSKEPRDDHDDSLFTPPLLGRGILLAFVAATAVLWPLALSGFGRVVSDFTLSILAAMTVVLGGAAAFFGLWRLGGLVRRVPDRELAQRQRRAAAVFGCWVAIAALMTPIVAATILTGPGVAIGGVMAIGMLVVAAIVVFARLVGSLHACAASLRRVRTARLTTESEPE